MPSALMSATDLEKYIGELEKENRKLRECNKSQSEVINNVFIPQQARLEEENKKLREDNKRLREGVDAGQKLVKNLILYLK